MAATSRKFKELTKKGNVNGAIKLLTNNMKGGILPLNNQTEELLRTKHLERRNATDDALLPGEILTVQPIIFDVIDDKMVLNAAQLTKEGQGHRAWTQTAGGRYSLPEYMVRRGMM